MWSSWWEPKAKKNTEESDEGLSSADVSAASSPTDSSPACLPVELDEGEAKKIISKKKRKRVMSYTDLYSNPTLRVPVLLYVGMCGCDFAGNELLPLWLITSRETGGLEMTAPQIGFITVIMGISGLVANFVFPAALAWYGDRKSFFQLANLYWAIAIIFTPLASMCFQRTTAIVVVVLMTCGRMFFSSWAFAEVQLFIAAVAPRESLGALNGIAQSSGCMARAIMPVIIPCRPSLALILGAMTCGPLNSSSAPGGGGVDPPPLLAAIFL